MAVKYYTFDDLKKEVIGIKTNSLKEEDIKNPLFNFDSSFLPGMKSISQLELAQSIPYIKLETVDLLGEVIDNLNINFFHKSADMEKIKSNTGYADRPAMSFESIKLKSTLAGVQVHHQVTLNLKIHNPDVLNESTIYSLILPGMAHRLTYGWTSKNAHLSKKEVLLFQVSTYDLSVDETGQISLVVNGTAYNKMFNSILVGDAGKKSESDADNRTANEDEIDGILAIRRKKEIYEKFLIDSKKDGQVSNNYEVVKALAESYKVLEKKARGPLTKLFNYNLSRLKAAEYKEDRIYLKDLVHIMLDGTFNGMLNIYPQVKEFRIIYGNVNRNITGGEIPESLALFPISVKEFKGHIRSANARGNILLRMDAFFNVIINNFIDNEEYWKNLLPTVEETKKDAAGDPIKDAAGNDVKIKVAKSFNDPEIILNFNNRSLGNADSPDGRSTNGSNQQVMEVILFDAKFGIPPTTLTFGKKSRGSSAKTSEEIVAASEYHLPIIQVGHANSFIKNMSFSQVTDRTLKAVQIERGQQDRLSGLRSSKAISTDLVSTPVTPIALPMEGKITVLGHVDWKPQKSLYVEMGIFLISGVYRITGVTHNISAGVFDSELILMYN